MAKKRPKQTPRKLSIDAIETQQIILVDAFGTERARLSCSAGVDGTGGMTIVRINDALGRPRLELQVDPNGNPTIRLSTENDGAGVSLGVHKDNGNGISVGDWQGDTCISIGVPNPGTLNPNGPRPDIRLYDPVNQTAWSAIDGAHDLPNDLDRVKHTSNQPSPPKT